jgi:hypothetical protein
MVFGDYYPLTPYSLDNNAWIGWQYDRPETSSGVLQIFRRQNATAASVTLQLHGLDPDKLYQVRNFDLPGSQNYTGQFLMSTGLTVALPPRGSAVFSYQEASAAGAGQQQQQQGQPIAQQPPQQLQQRPLLRPQLPGQNPLVSQQEQQNSQQQRPQFQLKSRERRTSKAPASSRNTRTSATRRASSTRVSNGR